MILEVVRQSGLSAWLMEIITAEGSGDPTPGLDRLRRYEEDLAAAIVAHLRELTVTAKVARKWLQVARGQMDPPAGGVEEARQHLETFVRVILPQILYDARGLRD